MILHFDQFRRVSCCAVGAEKCEAEAKLYSKVSNIKPGDPPTAKHKHR